MAAPSDASHKAHADLAAFQNSPERVGPSHEKDHMSMVSFVSVAQTHKADKAHKSMAAYQDSSAQKAQRSMVAYQKASQTADPPKAQTMVAYQHLSR